MSEVVTFSELGTFPLPTVRTTPGRLARSPWNREVVERRVPGYQAQRVLQERLPGLHTRPRRSPGGVRNREHVCLVIGKPDAHLLANDLAERRTRNEPLDGQLVDRDHEFRSKDLELGVFSTSDSTMVSSG